MAAMNGFIYIVRKDIHSVVNDCIGSTRSGASATASILKAFAAVNILHRFMEPRHGLP